MNQRALQLLRTAFRAALCVVVALVLAWKLVDVGEPKGATDGTSQRALVLAGAAGVPLAVPLLVQLNNLLRSR